MPGVLATVERAEAQAAVFPILFDGKPQRVVKTAVDGAIRRLATPGCQLLFDDFNDPAGHSLSANLEGLGKTGAERLADLYFVAGDDFPQCRRCDMTMAFTAPSSRAIYVCSERFADRFARNTTEGEILVIHELLHSLGLGENPPTSAEITN